MDAQSSREIERRVAASNDEARVAAVESLANLEEALHASHQRYEELVNSLDGIVWEGDPRTLQFTFVSRFAERVLGFPVTRWTDEPDFWLRTLHPEDAAWAPDACRRLTAEGKDHELEYRMIAADGSVVWLRDIVSIVKDSNGNRLRGLMVDVTRAKAQAKELEAARNQALAAAAAKSNLLATMSHEVRTPLSSVIGLSDLLLESSPQGEALEYVQLIRSSAGTLLQLINDILDLSKLEAGKVELVQGEFDLPTLLEETLSLFGERIREKEIELVCSIDPAIPPRVRGDGGRLRQILVNLIGNAVKFTTAGHVAVHVAPVLQKGGSPSDGSRERRLEISVRDTGRGISAEALGRLFQPFVQADASVGAQFGGTGLGLSVSKQLVELMGGQIRAESTLGAGSAFRFSIRLESIDSNAAGSFPLFCAGGARALVADRSAIARESLAGYLRSHGVLVEESEDGLDALKRLRAAARKGEPFHCAFVDAATPGVSADGLSRCARQDADTPLELAFLVPWSLRGADALPERAHRLSKPFRRREIDTILQKVADRGSTRLQLRPEGVLGLFVAP